MMDEETNLKTRNLKTKSMNVGKSWNNRKRQVKFSFPFLFMVGLHLSKQMYSPGDELRMAITLKESEEIQLVSVRCLGYIRLPLNLSKDIPNKDKYAFKDKPLGPSLPTDSMLLWYSPNFPIHLSSERVREGLVKMFLPFFLPPSIKGGLYEISHFVEVSVLNKCSFEMKVKRIPLFITYSNPALPILFAPAIGDGYEQFDYNAHPLTQSTPHGQRAASWEVLELLRTRDSRRISTSGIFKSRRNFRISFNHQHATEIIFQGEWVSKFGTELLSVEDGSTISVTFRFLQTEVFVREIIVRVIRIESITDRDEQFEACVFESVPPTLITSCVEEQTIIVPIPPQLTPSFRSDLVCLDYRLDFQIRATSKDEEKSFLDPVIWSLPLDLVVSDPPDYPCQPFPALQFGSVPKLHEDDDETQSSASYTVRSLTEHEAEIEAVMAAALVHPGGMKFNIYSSSNS